MYPQDLVDSVLSHSNIVDVISNYLNVIKKGKEFRAVCPFHADTDPSLMISQEKQIFKCFVCQEGGNAISFVRKYEKVSFDEAVRKVAEISGYKDPRLLKEVKIAKGDPSLEPIYNCINDLQKFYINGLASEEAEEGRKYLESRNLSDTQISKFGIGFSPKNGESTIKFLQAKGHSLKAIEGTGIALAGTNSKDNNAGRITFPLSNPYGQIIGYSARRIVQDDSGKYVNSPDGPIFNKAKILYNYHLAKEEARRKGYLYVFEGFMDVIALDKAGLINSVAIMGTALTDEQITLLKKLNCEIRLCLDGDGPGQSAMMRSISKLQKANITFRIVNNPGDLRDPDEILQEEGPEALICKLNNLVDPFQFQLNYYVNVKKLETKDEKKVVLSYFAPIIAQVSDLVERDDYVAKLAKATGFETSTIYREIARKTTTNNNETDTFVLFNQKLNGQMSKRSRYDKLFNAELHILFYMLKDASAVKFFENNISSFYNKNHDLIANYILDYCATNNQIPTPACLMSSIENSGEENGDELIKIISNLLEKESTWPSCNEKELKALLDVINLEKQKLYDYMQLNDSFMDANKLNKVKVVTEYIEKKKQREKWTDKK